jgi:anti-anti-sigma factor
MGIQDWSTDVILVDLPRRLEDHAELKTVIEMARNRSTCNVVVDFSNVDLVGSQTFARLLELRQVLQDSRHRLVLCGLSPATKGVFAVARLDSVFEFVGDRFAALANLQIVA